MACSGGSCGVRVQRPTLVGPAGSVARSPFAPRVRAAVKPAGGADDLPSIGDPLPPVSWTFSKGASCDQQFRALSAAQRDWVRHALASRGVTPPIDHGTWQDKLFCQLMDQARGGASSPRLPTRGTTYGPGTMPAGEVRPAGTPASDCDARGGIDMGGVCTDPSSVGTEAACGMLYNEETGASGVWTGSACVSSHPHGGGAIGRTYNADTCAEVRGQWDGTNCTNIPPTSAQCSDNPAMSGCPGSTVNSDTDWARLLSTVGGVAGTLFATYEAHDIAAQGQQTAAQQAQWHHDEAVLAQQTSLQIAQLRASGDVTTANALQQMLNARESTWTPGKLIAAGLGVGALILGGLWITSGGTKGPRENPAPWLRRQWRKVKRAVR